MRPFKGIQVLDLTQSIAGPVSTQFLGSLGADIVKVEPPSGDPFREHLGGDMFSSVNLGGKQSVCLDLKTDDGREAAVRLAEEADVIIESFRPGVVERFGLDYETVTKNNKNVVYLSLTGFGQKGPYSEWPAYDPIIQAMSGLMSTIGYEDRPPVRIGASVIDWGTGTTAAFMLASGLLNREITGDGTFIDVNLYEVAIAWMSYWITHYSRTGTVAKKSGQGFAGVAPNEVFHASNQEPFYLAVTNDQLYERLCAAIDRHELVNERFETNADRWENRTELKDELQSTFEEYDRDVLCELLSEAGVPAGPIRSIDDVFEDDPHAAARDLFIESYNVRNESPVSTVATPFTTSDGRPDLSDRPPRLGEHTRNVLTELGYSDDQIERMIEAGSVGPTE